MHIKHTNVWYVHTRVCVYMCVYMCVCLLVLLHILIYSFREEKKETQQN